MLVQVRRRPHKLLALVAFVALVVPLMAGFFASAGAQEAAPQPTITSDMADYPPGATVVLTGSNWQPGESVDILVNDDEGKTWSRDVTVTADENGDIRDEFQLPDWFVATYYVTATGDSGAVAKTTFTDPKVSVKADLLQHQERYLRYEVYREHNCTGGAYDNRQETRIGQTDSETANPDVPASRSVKLFASHKTVHTSNQHVHEVFDYWILQGSSTPLSDQTQDGVFTGRLTQNPNGTAHWVCVNGQVQSDRTFRAIYRQSTPPALSVSDVAVTEGNSGTTNAQFTATRTGNTASSSSVNYATADNMATASDYNARNGTINFAANETSKTVNVPVVGDTLDEPNESFFVNLSGATSATTSDGQGVGTINDDDAAPTLSINDVSVDEGDTGTTNAAFTVSLSAASGRQVTVDLATANDTAVAPDDYASATGTATFAPGQTSKPFDVTVNADNADENNEGFFANLSNANNATVSDGQGVGTIRDDDDTPVAKNLTGDDDRITTPEDTPKGITLTASDVDSTNLTFTIVAGEDPTNGTLAGSGANRTYTPNPNYNGPDAFKFRVCDDSTPTPLCDTGEVEILVTPVNDAPVAVDDSYTEDEGQMLTVDAPGLLANDSDEETPRSGLEVCEIRVQRDGSTATASGTNIEINNDEGRLISDGTGAFTFNPADDDYFGTFTFEYKTCDAGDAESAYATVTITYKNVNDAPRVDLNGSAAGAGDAATFTEGGGGIDVDTDRNLTVTDIDNANMRSGSVTVLNHKAGDVIFLSQAGQDAAVLRGISVTSNSESITLTNVQSEDDYRDVLRTVRFDNGSQNPNTTDRRVEFAVADNNGLSSNEPDSIVTVIEVNDAPDLTASNDGPIDEGEAATITGTATDPDTPAGELVYQFDCDDNGTYEERPAAGVNTAQCSFPDDGDYTVNVRVLDNEGGSDTASTIVTVNNVPPTVSGPENTNQASNEGENESFDLGSFADPGADGPWSVTVDWGDGSPDTTFNANAPGDLGQRQHAYDDNGVYDVTVTVDEAGVPAATQSQDANPATFTATVANVVPTATLFIRLTSCEEIVEPSTEEPPVETVSVR